MQATTTTRDATTESAAGDKFTWDRSQLTGKYLTFNLAGEEFGIEILKVREIIGLMDVTPVPGAPAYIRGVINLRGKIIPVMELRRRFDLEQIDDDERNCIIVVEVAGEEGQIVDTGILVDGVSEVLDIESKDIEPSPEFGSTVETSYILGMAKANQKVKILLNIEKIVLDGEDSLEQSRVVQSASQEQ